LVERTRIRLALVVAVCTLVTVSLQAQPAPVSDPARLIAEFEQSLGQPQDVPVLEPSLPALAWHQPEFPPSALQDPARRWSWADVPGYVDRLSLRLGAWVRDWAVTELFMRRGGADPLGGADRQIALYENKQVGKFIRLYLESHREAFLRGLTRAGQYIPMIQELFRSEGLPGELAYLAIVESNLNPRALSPKRAAGLWQFMPETAEHFGLRVEPWYDERLDPVLSTQAAARLLGYLHDRYGNWELALAAYNAGETRVNRALRHSRTSGDEEDFWNLSLPLQTRRYVPSFIAVALIYNDLAGHGLTQFEPRSILKSEDLREPISTTLREIARRTGLAPTLLAELNPAWRQGFIPPIHEGAVLLRLPPGGRQRVQKALSHGGPFTPPRMVTHQVSRGETLGVIAAHYGVDMDVILAANRIGNRHMVRRGQKLRVPLPDRGALAETRRGET
jgi:membrane-bound lytic murein transglycosylase D